jgi:AcrR family transcriptional regulator
MKDALLCIMKTKPFEKITVHEICKAAKINRSTFYNHYGNQSDILSDLENDMFAELERHMSSKGCCLDGLMKMAEFLASESEKWKSLANALPGDKFIGKLFETMIESEKRADHRSQAV